MERSLLNRTAQAELGAVAARLAAEHDRAQAYYNGIEEEDDSGYARKARIYAEACGAAYEAVANLASLIESTLETGGAL